MKFSLSSLPPRCRILVIRLRSIGDVVLNTPVLETVKKNLPACRLSVLVESPCEAVLRGNPYVDDIIIRRRDGGNFRSRILRETRFFRDLRRRRFHLVLDFHGGPRAAIIAFLSGGRWRMGHAMSPRRWAYNVRVKPPRNNGKVHTVEEQLSKLSCLGFQIGKTAPGIWVSEEEKETILGVLEQAGLKKGEPYAVIHPGTTKPHQRWQPEKMARVADHIQGRCGLKAVFASAPSQVAQVTEIVERMDSKALSMAGKTDLRQFIALASCARLVVCHNGGQMHLAAAAGTPVFALFGPSTPEIFGPVGTGHRVFYKKLPCSPCAPRPVHAECLQGEPRCKKAIEAREVIKAIDLLSGGRDRREGLSAPGDIP